MRLSARSRIERNESEALCNLGKAYAALGEVRKAIDYYEQSLEISRKIEYRRGEGDALFNMSLALDKLGQRPEAIDRAKAALVIFEQIESPDAEKARQKLVGVARIRKDILPSISLQLNRRRSAGRGLERRPNHSAGGPQGRLAAPRKKERMLVFLCIYCPIGSSMTLAYIYN